MNFFNHISYDMKFKTFLIFLMLLLVALSFSPKLVIATAADEYNTQIGDKNYRFNNLSPAFKSDEGTKVFIHRHVSRYVQRGSFEPFSTLIKSDGFKPSYLDEAISKEILNTMKIFVIANAHTKDYLSYSTLSAPSVYTDEQINLIRNWVSTGGSLLILADHSPFAGGTIKLAEAFGFSYMTGHAIRKDSLNSAFYVHMDFMKNPNGKKSGLLLNHPITNGQYGREKIDHFYTFGGQAIIPPPQADNLFMISDRFEAILTQNLYTEFLSAPRMDVGGFSQGAVMEFGEGKIAIFGETGGFSSQIRDGFDPLGFNHPEAGQNEEFILSTMRWLARFESTK